MRLNSMGEHSKKLLILKFIAIIIVIFIVVSLTLILRKINTGISISEQNIEIETKEKKITFDMTLLPNQQRIVNKHRKEYISQVYDYLFNNDVKWKNIMNDNPYTDLMSIKYLDNFYDILKGTALPHLFELLFDFNNPNKFKEIYLSYPLNMDDIPVTENYIKNHPKPLFEEFNDIIKLKKEYNTKKYYSEDLNADYWYNFSYDYGISVDEEKKEIEIIEKKSVGKMYKYREDGEEHGGIVRDNEGNEISTDVETRRFYFNYTLANNGYLDDVIYNKTAVIANDNYLDNMIKNKYNFPENELNK